MSNVFLVQCKQHLLLEMERVAANQLTHQPNYGRIFETVFPDFFFCDYWVTSDLLMDSNFCVSSTTYLSLQQQSTEGEHSEQLVDFQTQTFDNRK